ncbi:pyridoxal phosphate-dependent transferase [Cokeromyces recurvatus]|uniref:pyridoxal phosphate-dependent transferase n=1 Tax=Cokeromyces recurvatus TaxID=90255 RepID=UPI0022203144|nr:pyridoxal phosphate-dependent transferase [Cokeromyces recurvatus]KAI7904081.1 pyridoxal phosphate-dependent transferase [Cokeromyces recurvatus]
MINLMEPPTQVGAAIPAHTPHAVSVMFPTWQDNIYYEEGNPIVTSKMECGYPRFFIHPFIQKLCSYVVAKFGKEDETGMLFPSHKVAEQCRSFMNRYYDHHHQGSTTGAAIRIAEFEITPQEISNEIQRVPIHIVLFPKDAFPIAKQFWQHSGNIISSRMAEYCLRIIDNNQEKDREGKETKNRDMTVPRFTMGGRSRTHYNKSNIKLKRTEKREEEEEDDDVEQNLYLEERYGRNLPAKFALNAKQALRRRIAGVLSEREDTDDLKKQCEMKGDRGIRGLSEEDVYLYPCGMSAIYHAHQLAMNIGDTSLKSVCFGFPYTDTLKILQKWGAGCYFYGLGEDKSMDELEALLQSGERVLSLFCEFPSNPLLKSPDIKRLRRLADTYHFLLVVDETIGNFCNVAVLEWADMVVSSLTKIFSGDSNVMGGSMILNPNGVYYAQLKALLKQNYEDLVWFEDAVFLERNSRNFKERSHIINQNAEALCDFLVNHPKVEKVFYPKYVCREHFDSIKINTDTAGYGGLFSVLLKDEKSAATFYNNLHCAKGPSLGTNFTLCSPYTILAHYNELNWAEQYGVCRYLVRVSVGLEDKEKLLHMFSEALNAIE